MSDIPVYGQQELATGNTEFNRLSFIIKQQLNRINVATLVKVVAVNPGSGLLVGTVDVLPLVAQVDGEGKTIPHTTVYNLPYLRVQGGTSAVICDPKIGDLGFVLFADKDISAVKETSTSSAPPSDRRFSMSDGIYFGGWMTTTTPEQYLQITEAGINLVAGSNPLTESADTRTSIVNTSWDITVPQLNLLGTLSITGDLHVTGVVGCTWEGSLIAVQYGGTGADLSLTGGPGTVVTQTSAGAAFTVVPIAQVPFPAVTANTVFAGPVTGAGSPPSFRALTLSDLPSISVLGATVTCGTTTTIAAGLPATVTNAGTATAAIFNFGIPAGATGPTGPYPTGLANQVLATPSGTSGVSSLRYLNLLDTPYAKVLHGFEYANTSTLTFSTASRVLTITGTYNVWNQGTKISKSAVTETVTAPSSTGASYVYYDSTGALTLSPSPWSFQTQNPVAYGYWNATLVDGVFFDDRHPDSMAWATHYYQHQVNGAQALSGFAASAYTVQPSTASNATNQIAVASGTIADEDLQLTAGPMVSGGPYTVFYRSGSSGWSWTKALTLPYRVGTTFILANTKSGSNWVDTELANGQFVCYYAFATTALDQTNWGIFWLPGQTIHNSLATAQAESLINVDLTSVPFLEYAAIYQVIWGTGNNSHYTGVSGQCRIEQVTRINSTRLQSQSGAAVSGMNNPMTTLGDMIYGSTGGAPAALAGSTVGTVAVLTQLGTGSGSAAPAWALVYTATPLVDGVGSPGSGSALSLGNHVHPTDTSRQASATILTTLSALANTTGFLSNTTGGTLSYISFSATNPVVDGSATPGTSSSPARSDHVHPTDTSRLQNVLTTLGDLIYCSATGTPGTGARLTGNLSSTPAVLMQIGTGTVSAAPSWAITYQSNPIMNGVASAGTGTALSLGNHVHPSDTSRAAYVENPTGWTTTNNIGGSGITFVQKSYVEIGNVVFFALRIQGTAMSSVGASTYISAPATVGHVSTFTVCVSGATASLGTGYVSASDSKLYLPPFTGQTDITISGWYPAF